MSIRYRSFPARGAFLPAALVLSGCAASCPPHDPAATANLDEVVVPAASRANGETSAPAPRQSDDGTASPAAPQAGEPVAPPSQGPHRWEGYRWGPASDALPISDRIAPPVGFDRLEPAEESFAAWLRGLPTRPGRPAVLLHSGRLKINQSAHYLVIDIDTGTRDLQQCADAVIRLRAEWLLSAGREEDICFRFTSGDAARWSAWREGERARVSGNEVSWQRTAAPDGSHASFRRYLDLVFLYAGTWSLQRELRSVDDPRSVLPGDVLIQGGFPGHAVIVLDVAEHPDGRRAVLLGQSYMPAQDFHVLVTPNSELSPWYLVSTEDPVRTPEWRFAWSDLMRFQDQGCPPPSPPRRPGR